jgi:hypothetical protein
MTQHVDQGEALTADGLVVASCVGPDAIKAIMTDAVATFGGTNVLSASGGGLLLLDVPSNSVRDPAASRAPPADAVRAGEWLRRRGAGHHVRCGDTYRCRASAGALAILCLISTAYHCFRAASGFAQHVLSIATRDRAGCERFLQYQR